MIRKFSMYMLIISVLFLIAGCGNSLSSAFDEELVVTQSETVINLINEKDYVSAEYMMEEAVRDKLSAQVLQDVMDPILEKAGSFVSYKSTSVKGTSSKDGTDYATCVVKAEYENGTLTYTITFDTDYKIAGFYIK